MNKFEVKHTDKIHATLSCFDRVIFRGHLLPICSGDGMASFLTRKGIRIADFGRFVQEQSAKLKTCATQFAERSQRPYLYLEGHTRKDDLATDIAKRDNIQEGLICVIGVVEPCNSFKIAYGATRPRLRNARRKCLFLYFYFLDRVFGLMHVCIQTWFPFTIRVYVNGHSWLAKKLDRHGVAYQALDNSFAWIENPERAQRFADRFAAIPWLRVLEAFARKVNPLLGNLLAGLHYYWVTDQAEYSTDVIFKDHASLQGLYQKLLRHATLCFGAEDVMTFLGRKLHGGFAGQVVSDCKKRWQGARIKHRMKENWIKMYDKNGLVLRVETVINRPQEFKQRRYCNRKGQRMLAWCPMRKHVGNLFRYAEVASASNNRYLNALAVVDDPTGAREAAIRLSENRKEKGRSYRGFNPLAREEQNLLQAIMRGEYAIHGFYNRSIRTQLYGSTNDPTIARRCSSRIHRMLKRLHVRGLIARIPRTRRWRVTDPGSHTFSAVIAMYEEHFPATYAKAA